MDSNFGKSVALGILIWGLWSSLFSQAIEVEHSAAPVSLGCAAPKAYLSNLAQFSKSIRIEQDYSCLTDLSSINSSISKYQLVDLQAQNAPVTGAWSLSIQDLKLKSYLQDRQLLILGDHFSRVSAAANCSILKKQGFTHTKILIGGADLWRQYKNNQHLSQDSKLVSAKDFIYEYFNGSVVVVAANNNIAKTLKLLGVEKINILNPKQNIDDVIINQSQNGYLPVILIDESTRNDPLMYRHSNYFQLDGGVQALAVQLKNDVMADSSRFETIGVTGCENSKL